MKDPNCGYCARGELLDAFGIVICELSVTPNAVLDGV